MQFLRKKKRKKQKTLKKPWRKQSDLFHCRHLTMSSVGKKKKQNRSFGPSALSCRWWAWSLGKSSTLKKKKSPLIYNEKANAETERPALLTWAALGPRVQPQVQPVPGHVLQPAAGGRSEPDPCRQPELRAAAGALHPERGWRYPNSHGQTSFLGIPGN